MLHFQNQNNPLKDGIVKTIVINPYSQTLEDFDDNLNKIHSTIFQECSGGSEDKNSLTCSNQNQQQFQVVLEIEKIKYRIDYEKRLLKLEKIFAEKQFQYALRIVLNGEQAIQAREFEILKDIISQQKCLKNVEICINQVDNQYDWNLLQLLQQQIGILTLRIEKYCEQSLRSLSEFTNKIRILTKVHLQLNEDIPLKVFYLFAWPARIHLEIKEGGGTNSTLKLQFLSILRFISHLEITLIDNTCHSTQSLLLPILTKQIALPQVEKISFYYTEHFTSFLNSDALKFGSSQPFVDYSYFMPYQRNLNQLIQKYKFEEEWKFYKVLSQLNILDISVSITVNQMVQFFQIFQRNSSFTKLQIKIIPNQFNLFPQYGIKEEEDKKNFLTAIENFSYKSISIKNLILVSEKSLSFRNRRLYYDRFVIMCMHLLDCKITKLSLSIQSIFEPQLEMLSKKMSKNTNLKHLNIQFLSSMKYNNNSIINFANSHFQTLNCLVNKHSQQFFSEYFLNAKKLKALSIKIETVPTINPNFYKITTPYTHLQINQQIQNAHKKIIFNNNNIILFFNSIDGSKRTQFNCLYYTILSQLLSLNAFYKKILQTNEIQSFQFQNSFMDLLEF